MMLKEKMAQWLKSNYSLIVLAIGLLLLAINDSWLGLAMYCAVIHLLCATYIAGYYDENFIDVSEIRALVKQGKTKTDNRMSFISFFILCVSSIVILVVRDHWYLLVITIATIMFVSIHIIDGLQKIHKERKAIQ